MTIFQSESNSISQALETLDSPEQRAVGLGMVWVGFELALVILVTSGCAQTLVLPESGDRAGPGLDFVEWTRPIGNDDVGLWNPNLPVQPPTDPIAGPIEDCVTHCEAREGQGHCDFSVQPENGDCVSRCEEARGQSAAAQEAFLWCVENDPLCFQSVNSCVLHKMYPDEVDIAIRLVGFGYHAHEGQMVQGAIRVNRDEYAFARATVRGGEFELIFMETAHISRVGHAPLVHLYFDLDGDGACDTGHDPVYGVTLTHNGDFDRPVFTETVEGDFRTGPAILCDLHGEH